METTPEPQPQESGQADLRPLSTAVGGEASFPPLMTRPAQFDQFSNIWSSQRGEVPIQFWQFTGDPDGFLILGDQASIGGEPFDPSPVQLFKAMPGQEAALAHPTGFTWILDDKGSGNPNDINYFWPVAPLGYSALGIAISSTGEAPDPANYWCVRDDLLLPADTGPAWSDNGSGWSHHNGNLSCPVFGSSEPPAPQVAILPMTFLSDEFTNDNNGITNSFALLLTTAPTA